MVGKGLSAFKRALIESLKFLSAGDVLRTSSTCKFWQTLCKDDELWLDLLDKQGNQCLQNLKPTVSLQEAYRFMQKFVYVLRRDKLLLYEVSTGQWVSKWLFTSANLDTDLVITRANELKLFACGGSSSIFDAFFIEVMTGVVTTLRNMRVHRRYPGLCRYDQHIYCFAGDNEDAGRECDRIKIDTGEWEPLPNCLHMRYAFNPVVVRPVIYLPNGCIQNIEVFDTETWIFTALLLKTNQVNSSGNFFYDDEIVILGLEKAFLWKPGDSEGRSIKYPLKIPTAWSSYDPVVHAGEVILSWPYGNRWEIGFVNLTTFHSRTINIPDD